jgi:hypothetical protein
MAKVVAVHTISRPLDDGQTTQELPPGTVFELEGQELDDLANAGAVKPADDLPLTDLSTFARSSGALSEPATSTIIPNAVPADKEAAKPVPLPDDDDDDNE